MLEDVLLIWKFRSGDTAALCRIYRKYKDDLLKLAAVLSNDASLAEDVVHDVFVSFARTGSTIKLNGSLKSYLATSVVNRIRNIHRDKLRHRTVALDNAELIESQADRPDRWIVRNEELKRLSTAVAQLPCEQAEVVILRLRGDISFKQIAKLQETSINTIQSRYRYGVDKLRSILNGEVKK